LTSRSPTDFAVKCIAELRCKAADFMKTGLVFTINSSGTRIGSPHNTAIKSDSIVGDELHQGLKAAFEKLRAEQGDEPDWHPGSGNMVHDLVHPSMYPFVYGPPTFNSLALPYLLTDCSQDQVHPG
jgi:hypothetical protein